MARMTYCSCDSRRSRYRSKKDDGSIHPEHYMFGDHCINCCAGVTSVGVEDLGIHKIG